MSSQSVSAGMTRRTKPVLLCSQRVIVPGKICGGPSSFTRLAFVFVSTKNRLHHRACLEIERGIGSHHTDLFVLATAGISIVRVDELRNAALDQGISRENLSVDRCSRDRCAKPTRVGFPPEQRQMSAKNIRNRLKRSERLTFVVLAFARALR